MITDFPSISPAKQQRDALRLSMRQQRRALTPQQRRDAALALDRLLGRHPLFLRSRHIAFYLANDGELDLAPLIQRAWAMGKQCYLPVLSPLYHNRLWFAPYHDECELVLNRFGIPEPIGNQAEMRPAWSLDLVLTPLVAFDADGNRLGMGGGYYDRTLAYLARRRYWRKPHLVGTAYAFQQVECLPHEPWDVPLHGVATDSLLMLPGNGRVRQ
jgi:5-formyltetrahydrofolate cyclo-ligase